jgi:hypothetical protein
LKLSDQMKKRGKAAFFHGEAALHVVARGLTKTR